MRVYGKVPSVDQIEPFSNLLYLNYKQKKNNSMFTLLN